MRVLFLSWNAFSDPGSGAARSFRTKAAWLAEAGHSVRALCAAGFEGSEVADLPAHASSLGIPNPERFLAKSKVLMNYDWRGVNVGLLCTSTAKGERPEDGDVRAFTTHVQRILREHRPQLTIVYGGHRALHESMALAKKAGSRTAFALYNFGYEKRLFFQHVDRVTSNSKFMENWYRQAIGLRTYPLYSPVEPQACIAEEGPKDGLLFVNPLPQKGRALVATLCAMLAETHPKIPVVVAGGLGSEFQQRVHGNVRNIGPYDSPVEAFSHAKALLVPSLAEAFGRVAVEAVLNGIPVIGSDMGGVPEAMREGGIPLPIPKCMANNPDVPPEPADVKPWFDAVVRLWEDSSWYGERCDRSRQAAEYWSEDQQKSRIVNYYEAIGAGK